MVTGWEKSKVSDSQGLPSCVVLVKLAPHAAPLPMGLPLIWAPAALSPRPVLLIPRPSVSQGLEETLCYNEQLVNNCDPVSSGALPTHLAKSPQSSSGAQRPLCVLSCAGRSLAHGAPGVRSSLQPPRRGWCSHTEKCPAGSLSLKLLFMECSHIYP